MEPLVSWCGECGGEAVFDPVPGALPMEYACRGCDAAVLVGDLAVVIEPRFAIAA